MTDPPVRCRFSFLFLKEGNGVDQACFLIWYHGAKVRAMVHGKTGEVARRAVRRAKFIIFGSGTIQFIEGRCCFKSRCKKGIKG